MVQTRSMSKMDTKTATDTKIVAGGSKQTRKESRKNVDSCYFKRPTLETEALFSFLKDYVIRHRIPDVDCAGLEEWKQMSDLEKAPFIKTAMERRERGAPCTQIVAGGSKQTREKSRKNAGCPTVDSKAKLIFMEDYLIRHPVQNMAQYEFAEFAGQVEWKQMTDLQKAPFIEMVMEGKGAKPAH